MGLDQFAKSGVFPVGTPMVDFEFDSRRCDEIHYWRKHPGIQGWMTNRYVEKGGTDTQWGSMCYSPLALTVEDLDELERTVRARELPFTEGFFFGADDGSEMEDDLEFIEKARAELAKGRRVFYYSSW